MYASEQQAALLRAAVAEIKKHPETFEMSIWAGTQYDEVNQPCGTVCCLAGQIVRNAVDDKSWAEIIRREEHTNATPVKDHALRMLNLSNGSQSNVLFVTEYWPERFKPDVDCVCDAEFDEDCCCSAPESHTRTTRSQSRALDRARRMSDIPICDETGDDVDDCYCGDVAYDHEDEADLRRKCEQEERD
jgi:hypothetical protein